MNVLKVIVLALFLNSTAKAQNVILKEDLIGTWTASVTQFKSAGTKMMFDGSTITLNDNYSFTGKIMNGLSGNWKLSEGTVILDSPDTPEPIVLSDISKDSCIWDLDALDIRMTFHKNLKGKGTTSQFEPLEIVKVDSDELIGQWTNTRIEATNKTKEENSFLFGRGNNDILTLSESGQFSYSESSNSKITGRIFEGTWSVVEGVIIFKNKSNTSERLGITAFSQNSLILENMEPRDIPICGKTRIRFTHIKVTAADLKK